MIRLPLMTAFAAVLALAGTNATSAVAADFGGEPYYDNARSYSGRDGSAAEPIRPAPQRYDEDDRYPRPYSERNRGFGIQRVEAQGRFGRSAPYQVKQWRAREAAIEAWKSKAANRYGEPFAHWRAATDKRIDCDAGAGSVYCSVSARPARGWGYWNGWGSWRNEGWGHRASY